MSPESRPVATLSLSARLMDKVLKSGFSTVSDLQSIPQGQLQYELTLTTEEARELWTQLHPPAVFPVLLDALAAQTQEWRWMPVTTSCQALDRLFSQQGGGIRPGEVTEFCGLAGVGKSQLGMQLSINVQLPPALGGVNGSPIYLDTEGSFVAKRVQEMAVSTVALLHEHGLTDWTTDTILEGVRYCRIVNPIELLAMVRMLRSIVKADSKVRLIVVDSIAFLFRSNISSVRMRTKLIGLLAKQLTELAQEMNLAVVVMNHMSTKIEMRGGGGGDGRGARSAIPGNNSLNNVLPTTVLQQHQPTASIARAQPALGETWAKACTHRVRLGYHGSGPCWRTATLFKSPTIQEQTVQFKITHEGVRDLTSENNEDKIRKRGKNHSKRPQLYQLHQQQPQQPRTVGEGDDDDDGGWPEEDDGGMEMMLAKADWTDIWDEEDETTTPVGSTAGTPSSDLEVEMQSQPTSSS